MTQQTAHSIRQVFHDRPQLLKLAAEEFGLDWGRLFRQILFPRRQSFVALEGSPVGLCVVSLPGIHTVIRCFRYASEGTAIYMLRYLQEGMCGARSRLFWDIPERCLSQQLLAHKAGGYCTGIVYRKARDSGAETRPRLRFVWDSVPPF